MQATGMPAAAGSAAPAGAAATFESLSRDMRTLWEAKDTQVQQKDILLAQVNVSLSAAKVEALSHKKKAEELVMCIVLLVLCCVLCALCSVCADCSDFYRQANCSCRKTSWSM